MAARGRDTVGISLLTDAHINQLTVDAGLTAICRMASRSPSAYQAMDVAVLSGASLAHAEPGATPFGTAAIPHVLSTESKVVRVAMALRRIAQDIGGVALEASALPAHEGLAGRMMAEADCRTFAIHVAAQLARAGAPETWSYVSAAPGWAGPASHYLRGFRKGGERTATMVAFAAFAADDAFAETMAALPPEPRVSSQVCTAGTLALRMSESSPSGAAYPERAFAHAVGAFRDSAAKIQARTFEAEVEIADECLGMRPAA